MSKNKCMTRLEFNGSGKGREDVVFNYGLFSDSINELFEQSSKLWADEKIEYSQKITTTNKLYEFIDQVLKNLQDVKHRCKDPFLIRKDEYNKNEDPYYSFLMKVKIFYNKLKEKTNVEEKPEYIYLENLCVFIKETLLDLHKEIKDLLSRKKILINHSVQEYFQNIFSMHLEIFSKEDALEYVKSLQGNFLYLYNIYIIYTNLRSIMIFYR